MKLIECHIENFGRLSDYTYEFSGGLNEFCHENGWGKSTLAAFIKVMLYGFNNEGRRDELENERKRYRPWQGGVYGGKLSFEAGGRRYLVERTFGVKASEDMFTLRYLDTNIECSDFSSCLGEDIFNIDAKSFLRTIYISQNDCEAEVTDAIHAKLGNLTEDTDDINNYDTVINGFKKLMNEMSPTRRTGSVYKLGEQLAAEKNELRNGSGVGEAISSLSTYRLEQKQKYDALSDELKDIAGRQQELGVYMEYAAKREEYGRLNSEYNARRAVFTKEAEYFKKGIPDREEADLCIESNIALAAARSEALKYTLSEAESSALNAGRLRFSRGIPQSGEINTAYALLESYDNIERGRGRSRRTAALTLLCAVAAAVGMALAVFNKPAGIIFAAIGAALFILGVAALFIQRKNRHKSADELSSGLKNFLGRYYSAGEIGAASFEVCIRRLAESAGEYTLLCDKEESYLQACARAERLAGEIDGFLTKYGFEGSADILLPDIREHLQRYFPAKEEYERSRRRKADFENENDMEKIMSLQKPGEEGMESLNSRALKVREELESTHKNILDYDKQLDALMERAEELEELEAEVKELDERYKADKRKYELINKTKEFMEKAKLSFAAKYAAPVRKGFDRYYSMISGAAPGEYYIDADSNVTVYEAGMQRDSRFLSRGLRDLTGICMRMSLIEAMYKEEKPFIIFDEPFVNFDAAKIDGGFKLLSEIASEYQIIYFTCHPGRTKRNGGTD